MTKFLLENPLIPGVIAAVLAVGIGYKLFGNRLTRSVSNWTQPVQNQRHYTHDEMEVIRDLSRIEGSMHKALGTR